MGDGRSLIFGPVVEKPNKTAFITKDPTEIILDGEFVKVPLLITYTSHEALMYELVDGYLLEPGQNLDEPTKFIPTKLKAKMGDVISKVISNEMKNKYPSHNLKEAACAVSKQLLLKYFKNIVTFLGDRT